MWHDTMLILSVDVYNQCLLFKVHPMLISICFKYDMSIQV